MKLENPYLSENVPWRRGNLHAHTTLTDGELSPEEVIAAYEKQGYDFLAISDHDMLVPPADYQPLTRMTLLAADEVSRAGPHLLSVQIREVIDPSPDRQQVIDAIQAQGGFAVLNHPSWQQHYSHFTDDLMAQLTGYLGIEIYNGVIERLEGSALATDRWDHLLSSGRRLWGFAHDDSHQPGDIGRGWLMVQAADRSADALYDAVRRGRFYASTGVEIERIAVDDGVISVAAPNAQRIRFLGDWGRELCYQDAREASYRVTGQEGSYIRMECYGEGVKAAWTQPLFLAEQTT